MMKNNKAGTKIRIAVVVRISLVCSRYLWRWVLFFPISLQVLKPRPPTTMRVMIVRLTGILPVYPVRDVNG